MVTLPFISRSLDF